MDAEADLRPCPLSHLALSAVLDGGQVVDGGVLQHRQEDKDEADPKVDVHGLDVGHSGHGRVHSGDDGGHGQHCGDAWSETHKQFGHIRALVNCVTGLGS